MARIVEYEYRIHVGSAHHAWTLGEPGQPVPRFKVLRTVRVNGEAFEAPDERERAFCLQHVFTVDREAYAECDLLNHAWFTTDPHHPSYDPNFRFDFPEPPPQPTVKKTFTCQRCSKPVDVVVPLYHGQVGADCYACGHHHEVYADWPKGHVAQSPASQRENRRRARRQTP